MDIVRLQEQKVSQKVHQQVSLVKLSFQIREDFVKRNYQLLNKNILANQIAVALGAWISIRLDIVSILFMALACSFCIIFKEQSNPVMLGMLLTYILNLTDSLLYLLYLVGQSERKMVSVQRCFKILEVPQENFVNEDNTKKFKEINKDWPRTSQIEFKDVVLRYRPTTEVVLNKLSFTVKPGEKIGVVGRTGADGLDIKDVPLDYLRQKITIIPQDPTMFNETLRFNLDPMNENTDERIMQVLSEANLDTLVSRDKNGLKMRITENGGNLSSGEKQLICICRAILRKNKIVLLDEATANIDIVTEQSIQKLINLEFKDAAVITIAHRLNTIIKSDRVLVLSFGQLLEYDTPQNLMNDESTEFYKLLQELKKEEQENHK